jgi:hypothetical protein
VCERSTHWQPASFCVPWRACLAHSVSTISESPHDLSQFHRQWFMKFAGNARTVTKWWTVCLHELLLRPHLPNITDHGQLAALRLVVHIITTFVQLSNPFPHHSITRGIFTLYFTYLMIIISWFHISCIQKMDKRPYFTVGRVLNHLEHFKCTEQYVNIICFSHIDVCGLPMNEGRQRACMKSRPQCGGGNIWKRYLLSEYALYKCSKAFHESPTTLLLRAAVCWENHNRWKIEA